MLLRGRCWGSHAHLPTSQPFTCSPAGLHLYGNRFGVLALPTLVTATALTQPILSVGMEQRPPLMHANADVLLRLPAGFKRTEFSKGPSNYLRSRAPKLEVRR